MGWTLNLTDLEAKIVHKALHKYHEVATNFLWCDGNADNLRRFDERWIKKNEKCALCGK